MSFTMINYLPSYITMAKIYSTVMKWWVENILEKKVDLIYEKDK